MVRKQFFIRKDQQDELKVIAKRDGLAEAELVREGIDLVLMQRAQAQETDESWRKAIQSIKGLWKGRDDWDAFDAERRSRRAERRKRMNALMAKVKA